LDLLWTGKDTVDDMIDKKVTNYCGLYKHTQYRILSVGTIQWDNDYLSDNIRNYLTTRVYRHLMDRRTDTIS
jgi:hypothetical protein